ncbi:hypothetical protein ACFQE0_23280 [Methylobacterium komagatae]|uniref:Uncharacterized protein n=1 Tax=Methylobacterium komagatae TaxID=374425 RepID=A0ABW2BP40_9HYPH
MIAVRRAALLAAALTHATAFALFVGPASAKQPGPLPVPAASILFRHMVADQATKVSGAVLNTRPVFGMVRAPADRRLDRVVRAAVCTGC